MEMRQLTEIIINYINDNFLLFTDLAQIPARLKKPCLPLPTCLLRYLDTYLLLRYIEAYVNRDKPK
ncbi:hypothetical protein BCU90_01710 [Vibrio lentus]|nr:hypothetical protein BCU90_01710 [Vibrio lentus]